MIFSPRAYNTEKIGKAFLPQAEEIMKQKEIATSSALALLVIACLLSFSACMRAFSKESPHTYTEGAHRMEAAWQIGERRYEGILFVGEGSGVRDAEILYSSPAAMAGISVTRRSGSVRISLGDASLSGGEELASALSVFDLFSGNDGVILSEENGCTVLSLANMRLTVLRELTP